MKSICVVVFVLFTGLLAGAKTVEVTGENFSVDIPDAWTATAHEADTSGIVPVNILSATDDAKVSALEILACANPYGLMAGQSTSVTNLKNGISKMISSRGGDVQFTGESPTNLGGAPAYLLQYTITAPGSKPVTARTYEIAANGKLYLIALQTLDSSADPDLVGIANSLQFASPPELPKPHVSHRMLKIALLAGAVVGGLVALVVVIVILRRKSETEGE